MGKRKLNKRLDSLSPRKKTAGPSTRPGRRSRVESSGSGCDVDEKSLPSTNDDEVVLDTLVVDELVLLEDGHGNLCRSNV